MALRPEIIVSFFFSLFFCLIYKNTFIALLQFCKFLVDDGNLMSIPPSLSGELLAQTWYRLLHFIG